MREGRATNLMFARCFWRPSLPTLCLVACLTATLFAHWQRASAQQSSQEIDEGDILSFRTTEVLLPVTVRDRDGKLVTTLNRNDFRVFEDGRDQPLTDFAVRDVPVDVVLMVDASSSVAAN